MVSMRNILKIRESIRFTELNSPEFSLKVSRALLHNSVINFRINVNMMNNIASKYPTNCVPFNIIFDIELNAYDS